MKLWLLERRIPMGAHYDTNCGFVIRAQDEGTARNIAVKHAADEGASTWLESTTSKCIELDAAGAEGVILSDFNAG